MPNCSRLLLVDEDRFVRVTLAAALRAQGYEVHEAATAAEAVDLDELSRVELAIVALTADQTEGIDTIASICAQRRIPSIALTNTADQRRLIQALGYGTTTFIEKPTDVGGLCALIVRALGASEPPC